MAFSRHWHRSIARIVGRQTGIISCHKQVFDDDVEATTMKNLLSKSATFELEMTPKKERI
jgi:hypothetical protein